MKNHITHPKENTNKRTFVDLTSKTRVTPSVEGQPKTRLLPTKLFLEKYTANTKIERAQINAEAKVAMATMFLCASFPAGTCHTIVFTDLASTFNSMSVHKHGSNCNLFGLQRINNSGLPNLTFI